MAFKLPFALFLQARNRPVGQSQLANQSARISATNPNLKKIAWNAARTTGNPVYPHRGSSCRMVSFKFPVSVAVYSQSLQIP